MARLAPYAIFQELDNNGAVLAGGKLYTYDAGTTTPKATYTTATGVTANANPIILDASGRADVWLGNGAYKFVLKDSADTTIKTVDNIAGESVNAFVNDVFATSVNTFVSSVYRGTIINATAAITITIDAAATLGENFYFSVINNGTGNVIIDPNASETINGATSLTLTPGESVLIVCDGTNWLGLYARGDRLTTGDVKFTIKTSADAGWIMLLEGSIGSATSGATIRANADTAALFSLFWNNISDTFAPVSSGRGLTAAADFAANKALFVTRSSARLLGFAGAGSGLTTRALGETLGTENETAPLPVHSHGITEVAHRHIVGSSPTNTNLRYGVATGLATGNTDTQSGSDTDGGYTSSELTGITINNAGTGGTHNNMPPALFLNAMIKL